MQADAGNLFIVPDHFMALYRSLLCSSISNMIGWVRGAGVGEFGAPQAEKRGDGPFYVACSRGEGEVVEVDYVEGEFEFGL